MSGWLVIAIIILVLVMAATIWFRWGSPDFAYGVGKRIIQSAIAKALGLDVFAPATPEEQEKFHKRVDRAEDHGLVGQRKREKGW